MIFSSNVAGGFCSFNRMQVYELRRFFIFYLFNSVFYTAG